MSSQTCISNSSTYPVPLIGLYVTGANLVCLLAIAIDIYLGFRYRKKWLPCRLFTLNSVTLAVIFVATKLPMDLTSSMPSAVDQLSKLTGTTFICIYMAFFMPSPGRTSFFESISNTISLAIFVFTVFINICIQIHTDVITSFKADHIIVLCCMIVLLSELGINTKAANDENEKSRNIKHYVERCGRSLLEILKWCFLCGYLKNTQFVVSRRLRSSTSCVISIVCAAILLTEIFRSLVFKKVEFRGGHSDYKWSMNGIVVSQTITVLVGCFGTTIRILTVAKHLQPDACDACIFYTSCPYRFLLHPMACLLHPFVIITRLLFYLCLSPFYALKAVTKLCRKAADCWCQRHQRKAASKSVDGALFEPKEDGCEVEDMMRECKHLISTSDQLELDGWALRKGVKELSKMIC